MAQNVALSPIDKLFALSGAPLNNGKLYFGEVDQDPEQFPVQMFWDEAGTIPALQPIRTISGYPVRAGTPAVIYGPDSYSMRVKESSDVQVFYIADVSSSFNSDAINFLQSGTGAVSRTVQNKERDIVSVKDFGAVGDGVTVDTVAIQAAMNSGHGHIYFPKGNYLFSSIIVPNTVHMISGDGATATKWICTGTIANFTPWINFSAVTGLEVFGFSISQNIVTYNLNHCFNVDTCMDVHIHDIRWEASGFYAVYMASCTRVTVENNVVITHGVGAFRAEFSSVQIKIVHNDVLSAGTDHGIQIATGSNHEISGNSVYRAGPGCFCIAIGASDSIVSNNRVTTNTLEGINLQDASRVSILGNIVFCEAGHTDFAISIYAANTFVESCIVSGNRTYNSGSSGIGVASTNFANAFCRYNSISNNLILNPIQSGVAVPALGRGGINLYGPQTVQNTVQSNVILDQASNMLYGVNEWDDSLGPPTNNFFVDNVIPLAAGMLFPSHRLSTSTRIWDVQESTWVPTVTSSAGALTSYTVNTARFTPRGNLCELSMDIVITDNGTGSGNIGVTLPPGFASTTPGGMVSGKEIVTNNWSVTGATNSTTMTVMKYDGAYPVATNSRLVLEGQFRLA